MLNTPLSKFILTTTSRTINCIRPTIHCRCTFQQRPRHTHGGEGRVWRILPGVSDGWHSNHFDYQRPHPKASSVDRLRSRVTTCSGRCGHCLAAWHVRPRAHAEDVHGPPCQPSPAWVQPYAHFLSLRRAENSRSPAHSQTKRMRARACECCCCIQAFS